jgi:asparagine synthetase B (glutamine-hydrolysing)
LVIAAGYGAGLGRQVAARLVELGQCADESWDKVVIRSNVALAAGAGGALAGDDDVTWIGCPAQVESLKAERMGELQGPFAFAAVSGDGLLLGRGRLGGYPLYYARDRDNCVIACSRLAPLVRLLGKRSDLDEAGIAEQLLCMPGGPATVYAGVRRLCAAELLTLGPRGETRNRLPDRRFEAPRRYDPDELSDELLHLISLAVRRAVGSARRIAVSVGGLDSSGLLAVAHAQARGASQSELAALTLQFSDPDSDDPYVRDVCNALGIEPARLRPSECARYLLDPVAIDAAPITLPMAAWTLEMGHWARERGIEVFLGGEGGDQLFDGDMTLFASQLLAGHSLRALQNAARLRGLPYLRSSKQRIVSLVVRPAVKHAFPRLTSLVRRWRTVRGAALARYPWAGPALRRALKAHWPIRHVDADPISGGDTMNRRQLEQSCSLYSGCRWAQPYLDDDIAAFVSHLPKELLFHGGYRRGLFRHAFRHLLPDSVRLRESKSGFGAALAETFNAAGGMKLLDPYISMPILSDLGFVEPQSFRKSVTDLAAHPNDPARWMQIWPAVAMEAFLSRSLDGNSFGLAENGHAAAI